jgi:hypothetical protein
MTQPIGNRWHSIDRCAGIGGENTILLYMVGAIAMIT